MIKFPNNRTFLVRIKSKNLHKKDMKLIPLSYVVCKFNMLYINVTDMWSYHKQSRDTNHLIHKNVNSFGSLKRIISKQLSIKIMTG